MKIIFILGIIFLLLFTIVLVSFDSTQLNNDEEIKLERTQPTLEGYRIFIKKLGNLNGDYDYNYNILREEGLKNGKSVY